MLVSIILAVLVLMAAVIFVGFTAVFMLRYGRPFSAKAPEPADIDPQQLPSAVVLVGLRGADPFLLSSLKSLMTQDYPDYQVHLVVDSRDDPAWNVVEEAIKQTSAKHVVVEEFRDDPADGIVNSTNSKIVQAARSVDESIEVIAMMDGDSMPHSRWLHDLIVPLAGDPSTGASYGNRWFSPRTGKWGSMVRYVWNAAVVPPMDFLKMPWGGCFAIRSSVVQQGKLLDLWAKQIALDAGISQRFRQMGLKLRFVPQMIVFNREECGVGFATNFIRRQLTWTRLYHEQGWLAIAQPLAFTLLLISAFVFGLIETVNGLSPIVNWPWLALLLFWITCFTCIGMLEWTVRRAVAYRNEQLDPIKLLHQLKTFVAIPISFGVVSVAAMCVLGSRTVKWRGLTLHIENSRSIRVVAEDSMPSNRQSRHESQ